MLGEGDEESFLDGFIGNFSELSLDILDLFPKSSVVLSMSSQFGLHFSGSESSDSQGLLLNDCSAASPLRLELSSFDDTFVSCLIIG